MSELSFPSFPGVDIKFKRTPVYSTAIKTSRGGYEQRVSYQSTPRYRYEMQINFTRESIAGPSPYEATNEVEALFEFVDTHKGRWDAFYLTDPYTQESVRVRFDMDEVEFERFLSGVWGVKTLKFISLKSA